MNGLQIAFKDWVIPIGNQKGGQWGSPWAHTDGKLDIFKNFKGLFSDPKFWKTLVNTLRISSLRIIFGFPIPIILVLILNELTSEKYKKFVQGVSYLPYFISWVIISNIFFNLTKTDSSLQLFLEKIFGRQIEFFGDDNLFLVILILTDIWKNAGWGTIIYFAALSNVSPEQYEAASIDGANRFQKMLHVTVPLISGTITIYLLLQISGLLNNSFEQFYMLQNSANVSRSEVLATYSYKMGIVQRKYSYTAAMNFFDSACGLILLTTSNLISKRIVFYINYSLIKL